MGIRETLSRHPAVAGGFGVGLVALAIGMSVWTQAGPPGPLSEAYYSDDGKTFFVDRIDKIYPFDRGGRQAYRATVYRCADGKPFVSYLSRYPDAARAKLTELSAKTGDDEAAGEAARLRSSALEVRKPGDEKWVPLFSPAGESITMHPKCPDGGAARDVAP